MTLLVNRWFAAARYQEVPDAFWRLGDMVGSATALDASVNALTASVVNGTVTVGQPGWPVDGDTATTASSSGYLDAGNVSALSYTGRFTVALAFTTAAAPVTEQALVSKWSASSSIGWQFVMATTGKLRFDGATSSGTVFSVVSSSAYTDGVYHHAVAVFDPLDSSTASLYVDGQLVKVTTPTQIFIAPSSARALIFQRDA